MPRKRTPPLLSTFAVFALLVPAGCDNRDDRKDWQKHFDAGAAALEEGNRADAEAHFERAVSIARRFPSPNDWDICLQDALDRSLKYLAITYGARGKHEEMVDTYEKLLDLRKQVLTDAEGRWGKDNVDTAYPLERVAEVYEDLERFAEAERSYRHALGITERECGVEHPAALQVSLQGLTRTCRAQGNYIEAEKACTRWLALRKKEYGATAPETLYVLSQLAGIYLDNNSPAKAERAVGKLVKSHPVQRDALIIRLLNDIALSYAKQGQQTEAEALRQRIETMLDRPSDSK